MCEAAIEIDVSSRRADVLNCALNTSADNIQVVDRSARVDEAAGAACRKRGDGSINLKIATTLLIIELNVSVVRVDSEHLRVGGRRQRNQKIGRIAVATHSSRRIGRSMERFDSASSSQVQWHKEYHR